MDLATLKQNLPLSKVACQLGISLKTHGRQKCPFCGSSTGFRIQDDFKYNCFACGVYGTVIDLPIHAGVADTVSNSMQYLSTLLSDNYTTNIKPTRLNGFFLDAVWSSYRDEVDQDFAVSFLQSRGISKHFSRYAVYTGTSPTLLQRLGFKAQDLARYGLVKDRRELLTDRVVFQIKDWSLRTHYLQGRAIDPNCELRWLSSTQPYQNISYQLFKVSIPDTDTLYIAEGITDTLTLLDCGLPAVGVIGVNVHLTHHAPTISKYKQVYVCLDNDRHAIGTRYSDQYKSWRAILPALLSLASECPNTSFLCSIPPDRPGIKDINDWYQTEPDLPTAITKHSIELPEFILRTFCNRQYNDLQPDIFRYFYTTHPDYLPKLEQQIKQQGESWYDYTFRLL